MNRTISALYLFTIVNISILPDYQEKIKVLAKAKLTILDELEQLAGKDLTALLDAYTSLDGEREEQHERMVFEAALKMGMELGRLTVTA